MTTTIWLAGRYHDSPHAWAVLGVFTTEKRAVAVCLERNDFVGPLTMNLLFPQDVEFWPGAYYPLAGGK